MDFFTALIIIWLLGALTLVIVIKGRKALSIFPDKATLNILFRDQAASGASFNNAKSSFGSTPLDIIVTDKEVWLSSPFLFAALGKYNDVIHRISREQIQSVNTTEKGVLFSFKNQDGLNKQVNLLLKNKEAFLEALK